jgi:dTDP-4-dehydrorhamnose 3,5-epimerase
MEVLVEGLEAKHLEIPELMMFRSPRNQDRRGYVAPTYSRAYFLSLGIDFAPVHENHCWSPARGTIRGFHWQRPPHVQPKLIRVTRGRILDVNVDLRRSAPTFGRHVKAELAPGDWDQIFVPAGFAHCYCTLEPDTEVIFKLGAYFAPGHAAGLAWNDPDLAIDWPVAERDAIVLDRDLRRPRFSELTELFP